MRLSIERQPLRLALQELAEQSGLQMLIREEDVDGSKLTARAVSGIFSPEAALRQLLAETGLQYEFVNERMIRIAAQERTTATTDTPRTTPAAPAKGDDRPLRLAQSRPREEVAAGESEPRRTQDAEGSGPLAQVVVTAQKREQSLQDVPMSITAVTGENLARSGITNSQDLSLAVPGLSIGNVGTLGSVSLRGVNTSLQGITSDPSAAIYVDGVYQPRFESSLFELMDVQRVEVLKGPQVVLYGRNATAGSILFISNEPSDRLGGHVDVQFGNYDHVRASAAVDIPLSPRVLVRATALSVKNEGYTRNVLNSLDRPGKIDIQGGRVTLKFLPSDDLEITLRAYTVDQDGSSNAFKAPDPLALGSAYDLSDPREVSSNQISSMPTRDRGVNAKVDWDLGAARLTSITAYAKNSFGPLNYDADAVEATIFHIGVVGQPSLGLFQNSKSVSQELYLSGQDEKLDWLAGAVYTDEDGDYGGADEFVPGEPTFFPATNKTQAYAVYGQLGYAFTDKLDVSAGVRYSNERKTVGRTPGAAEPGPLVQSRERWEAWTPSMTASYHLGADDMIYATVSRGFKSGGYSQFDMSPAIDPETITSYELGAKNSWLGGRVRSDISVYKYEYKDMQVSGTDPSDIFRFENAGAAEGEGLEVAVSALPTERLQIDAAIALMDATYDRYDSIVNDEVVSYAGNRLVQAPKFSGSVGAAYTAAIPVGGITFRVDYYHSSRQFFTSDNDPTLSQGAYSLLNARITFTPSQGGWEFSAFGRNLADRVIYTGGYTLGSPVLTLDAPRTYGAELKYSF